MDRITLEHGSGGRLMHELIDGLFLKALKNDILGEKSDAASLAVKSSKLAFTTDSYVINPIIFPGGDIGSLSIYGTVNDLSVSGARPLYISVGMVIEEGLEINILERITKSIAAAAKSSGVKIVTGDIKVVEKGHADKIFINTSGIGEIFYKCLSRGNIKKGDAIIINGPIGEHAVSILSKREGMNFGTTLKSDLAPLNKLISKALKASNKVRFMRDPTRGGVATTLNEIVKGMKFGIAINEEDIPVSGPVKAACELLGLDPLYLACEGRVIVIAAKTDAMKILKALGRPSRVIGEVTSDFHGRVWLNTEAGGRRILDMLAGDQLPRIC